MEQEKQKKSLRPEAVMAVIALVCLVGLIVVVALCVPHFTQASDPESLLQHIREEEQNREEVDPLEPTEDFAEETTEPTIPPEANPYSKWDFQYDRSNYLYCTRQDSFPGIDVSSFQGEIDWKQVKQSGIRFAMVRLGYRGYGMAGNMVEDEYARRNLEGARKAGLEVGAYFFSQATSIDEVDDEIFFFMKTLGDFPLTMPIVLDWEYISDTARTAYVDARTLTDMQKHFCKTMVDFGYQPMVYFNWSLSSKRLYLNELEDYPFWLALYQDEMVYPFRVEMWQYTCTGRVPGIQGDVDINVFMPDSRKTWIS